MPFLIFILIQKKTKKKNNYKGYKEMTKRVSSFSEKILYN